MTTRKTETGKPAPPLAVETKDELTDGALEQVSGGDTRAPFRTSILPR